MQWKDLKSVGFKKKFFFVHCFYQPRANELVIFEKYNLFIFPQPRDYFSFDILWLLIFFFAFHVGVYVPEEIDLAIQVTIHRLATLKPVKTT